ncbi:hypothetical protein K501DRAFT_310081 [Backusella circina FSU 941]|nr:hypothetical protein K501DRAFT_310081 [Backusella circina FSU 941]
MLPERLTGIRRYNTPHFVYIKAGATEHHPLIEEHFGCPSCIAQFKELKDFKEHISRQKGDNDQLTQKNNDNERESPSSKRPSEDDVQSLVSMCLSFSPPEDNVHLLIHAFDATDAFYKLQQSLQTQKWKLSLEDHIHYALACTSILLLSPNKYPDDLLPFFDVHSLTATINHIETTYNINKLPMPIETVMDIIKIIQEVLDGTAIREMAAIKLLKFDPTLPRMSLAEDSNEMELCSRFIDPFLSGLFDDPDQNIFLRWTNETTLEAKNEQSLLSWRPDLCITRLQGVKRSSSLVICRDLLRVAMFCKDVLDSQKMVGVLGIQIVGRTITFYVLVLPSSGLYIPDSLHDLSKLVKEISNLLLVLDTFDRVCIPSTDSPPLERHRPTITNSTLDQLFLSSQNRKRPCHLKHQHN